MATQIFSSSYAPMSVFKRKKQEPQSQVDYSAMSVQNRSSGYSTPASSPKPSPTPMRSTVQSTPRTMPKVDYSMMSRPGQTNTALQKIQQAKQQQQLPATDPSGINPLIAKAREIAQRQAGFYSDQADTRAAQLKEQQGIRTKYADERVSKLEALRDAAIGRIQETVPLQEQATQEYKTQVEDQYGRQMKEQAQAQSEEQRGIQDLFAGLNTIDSGAFITQGMKSRERLTANQTATIQARTNELNAADRDLKMFKSQAQELIAAEVQKFDDALLTIAENFEVGTAEYNAAIQQVYDQAQEAIFGLEAGLAERELAYEEKAQALQQEMMIEQMKNGTQSAGASGNSNKALTMVNNLLNTNTKPITGLIGSWAVLPGSKASTTKADWEGLKNLLALAGRGQLKGSGQVSDFEAKMLEKAAMAGLDTNMSDEEFRRRLQALQQDLMAGGAVDTSAMSSGGQQQAYNSTNDPLGLR